MPAPSASRPVREGCYPSRLPEPAQRIRASDEFPGADAHPDRVGSVGRDRIAGSTVERGFARWLAFASPLPRSSHPCLVP